MQLIIKVLALLLKVRYGTPYKERKALALLRKADVFRREARQETNPYDRCRLLKRAKTCEGQAANMVKLNMGENAKA